MNHVLDGGSDPLAKGQLLRGEGWLSVKYRLSVLSCAKMS